jgi:hypothetical protein
MRKYYPLTVDAWEQAKTDLSSIFPNAIFTYKTMHDEDTKAMCAVWRCHMIDPFKLEEELKRAGIMREDETFSSEFLERIPNGKRAFEIVNALVCPEPPWIEELEEEEKEEAPPPPVPVPPKKPTQSTLF